MWFWLLFVAVFWKPLYWLGKYLYHKFKLKDNKEDDYFGRIEEWFKDLWRLVGFGAW